MKPAPMEYLAARSPDDVLDALADGDTAVLAGGQSLVLDVVSGAARPRRVVDINRVPEFAGLSEDAGVLRVAPLVRHRTFESDAVGGALGDMLRIIVRHIGHPPIRARGTMLGSLAYAHPAAEWPVVATVLGAQFDLAGPGGRRTVAAEQFFTGPFQTLRQPEELLAEVRLPALPAGTGAGFAEHRRSHAKYAEVAAMAAVTVTDGLVSAAVIGLVNVGPCPVRARAAERTLIGREFCDAAITAAAEAAADLDAQHPAEGRDQRRAVRVLTRRALTQAREGW
ncbi:xanthine dehydrogenase family protein subunit M [Actinoplanes sp. N902-109]|uniref:FAD binding domain-containing protein n=1 Tax=Actinoplanes sp. (strain N902-109) TaxID=649831 RepID=UPI0003295348|nr:FAD binding domain-containing protein [Actinoplanes sp. N902-109]AGL18988.1 FAD-binding molybdopterin dehydrogenase [Actinoplanes sp. N902-109]